MEGFCCTIINPPDLRNSQGIGNMGPSLNFSKRNDGSLLRSSPNFHPSTRGTYNFLKNKILAFAFGSTDHALSRRYIRWKCGEDSSQFDLDRSSESTSWLAWIICWSRLHQIRKECQEIPGFSRLNQGVIREGRIPRAAGRLLCLR
jgi:hypothetical protein